jgi:hypothetical protein
MRTHVRGRSIILESQGIYGPVALLVGVRVTATRPTPRHCRRATRIHRAEDRDLTGII